MKKSTVTVTLIPLSEITTKAGLNPRRDSPGIEDLKTSILEYGVQEPLKVYLDPELGKFIVVKGHRRLQASRELSADMMKPEQEIEIPCTKYGGIPEDETILRDHVISNSGVPFSAIEKAEIVNRYKKLGFTTTEIAPKISLTYQQVWNLEKLHEAPEEIKEMIQSGIISSTLVVEEFKKKKDFDSMLSTFKEILLSGAAKITSGKINEFQRDDSQEEEEYEDKNQESYSDKETTKKVSFEQRTTLFMDELKLNYNDQDPNLNNKINLVIEVLDELFAGTEATVIIKSIFKNI